MFIYSTRVSGKLLWLLTVFSEACTSDPGLSLHIKTGLIRTDEHPVPPSFGPPGGLDPGGSIRGLPETGRCAEPPGST